MNTRLNRANQAKLAEHTGVEGIERRGEAGFKCRGVRQSRHVRHVTTAHGFRTTPRCCMPPLH